jgi:dTMP kinase
MRSGRLITFEGIEGCGKTTQWQRASQALAAAGHEVCATREPGGTPLGERLRALLLDPEAKDMEPAVELLLYCADRADHTARVVRPALNQGKLVLCDRYADATVAYQGFARGLGLELVQRLDLGRTHEDLTLLFDLPVSQGLERARARNRSRALEHEARFEQEDTSFHERVRQGYLEIARREPERVKLLDATASAERLFRQVMEAINALVETPA